MNNNKYTMLSVLCLVAAVAVTIINILHRRKLSDISYQQGWLEGYCDKTEEESENEVSHCRKA